MVDHIESILEELGLEDHYQRICAEWEDLEFIDDYYDYPRQVCTEPLSIKFPDEN